jgi:hypothetical protein
MQAHADVEVRAYRPQAMDSNRVKVLDHARIASFDGDGPDAAKLFRCYVQNYDTWRPFAGELSTGPRAAETYFKHYQLCKTYVDMYHVY